MEIILLERVANLGKLGDRVKVKSGYGRNFLIPYGKAVPATQSNVEAFEKRRSELEAAEAERMSAANSRAEKLAGVEVTIAAKSGDEGKLFGSISSRDIADALEEQGHRVERNEIRMPDGAIRHTGEYEIELDLHSEIEAVVKVLVVAE